MPNLSNASRFGCPVSSAYVEAVKKSRIPKKMQVNIDWATKLWQEWAACHMKNISPHETGRTLGNNVAKMELADVSFWLQRFVLEVWKSDGDVYSSDSLYQLCCGI